MIAPMCQHPYLSARRAFVCRSRGDSTMYRVIAIVGGALALAACSSTPDWMSLDALRHRLDQLVEARLCGRLDLETESEYHQLSQRETELLKLAL